MGKWAGIYIQVNINCTQRNIIDAVTVYMGTAEMGTNGQFNKQMDTFEGGLCTAVDETACEVR